MKLNNKKNFIKSNFFAIYGLGKTGLSVINFLKKNNNLNFVLWDDNQEIKKKFNLNNAKKELFLKSLDNVDYIVMSPGINANHSKFKEKLIKNKRKVITDIDIFYKMNPNIKSIVVTGTNGKSTTCKIIEHVLKKNKKNVVLGGNIGQPLLNFKYKKNTFVIIEASSYQLSYSKFIKPTYALLLNLTNDHLDWHGTKRNYIKAKMKIFENQNKREFAFIKSKFLIKKIKKKNNLVKISSKKLDKIKEKINNKFFNFKINEENLSFVLALSRVLKIKTSSFINYVNSFRGLQHRHEIFFKKNNVQFINDSKATSFKASEAALQSNKNIYWIVGGLPKLRDKFVFKKKNMSVLKAFIIGKNISFFSKQLKGKINCIPAKHLKKAIILILNEIKSHKLKIPSTVLLSPASASFDQYKNFQERGKHFKKLIKLYAKS